MSDHQADYPIASMCRLLGVSSSGYYAWRQRRPSRRAVTDAALLAETHAAHGASRGIYGAPRIHADLAAKGIRVVPDAHQPAVVLAAVKDKPCGRPQEAAVLDAAAPDSRDVARVGKSGNRGSAAVGSVALPRSLEEYGHATATLLRWSRCVFGADINLRSQ